MQSVSLKKPLTFPRSARSRQHLQFLSALLVAVAMLSWAVPARAQDTQAVPAAAKTTEKFDVGLGVFYQVTNASNGNFIREDTTTSGGGLVSFRQPYRPWLGYEANLGYTRFSEAYNKGVVKLADNVTDLNVSYLLQSPVVFGFQPFFTVGGGIIFFSPMGKITNLNSATETHLSSQLLPEFTYGLGLNYPLFTRFGVRAQLRGLRYKTPDFHQLSIDTHTLRTTLEPTISAYYRF